MSKTQCGLRVSRACTNEVNSSEQVDQLESRPSILHVLTAISRKDNTMVHVLNSLARLELKFDDFASHHSPSKSDASTRTPNTSRNLQPLLDTSRANHLPRDDFLLRPIPRYWNLTVPHKVFLWPSISSLIAETGVRAASDIHCISEKGTLWLVGLEMAKHPLLLSCGHCRSNPRLGC